MKRRVSIFVAVSLAAALCLLGGLWPASAFADGAIPSEAAAARERLAPGAIDRVIVSDITTNTTLSTNTTVNGDMQIEKGFELDMNGLTLTVNGDLIILGTLHVNNGTLNVTGNVDINGGTLMMMEANGAATISGNLTAAGSDHTGKLTAGAMKIGGDFFQYNNYSNKAFCPSGAFKMEFTSTRTRLIYFDSPSGSWLYGLTPFTTYKTDSVFSLYVDLSAASTLSYPHLSIQGLMKGKALTVADTADAEVEIAGSLTPGGGTLTVNDALKVTTTGGVTMTNAADKLDVNGSFYTYGLCDCQAGTVEIDGDFKQFGIVTDSAAHNNAYTGLPVHITKITGANRTIHFDTPAESYFGQLDISGATLTAGSDMSLNCNLSADTALDYDNLYFGGSLNGHALTVSHNLYARRITPAGGSLTVDGNFTSAASNCLIMTNDADSVLVKGSFTTRHTMDAASMAKGTLEIRGNFTQAGDATSFRASGAHLTKLSGANKTVSFANPGTSYFNRVELAGGATFASGSTLSMNCTLGADTAYNVPTLYFSGSAAGHALSVTGNLHLFGAVNPNAGSISATGSVSLDAGATLTMTNAADRITCGGAFTGSGSAAFTAGNIEFKKSFRYTGSAWAASGGNITTLSGGAGMAVIFDNPTQNWFSRVVIASGTTLSSSSVLPINATDAGDLMLAAPLIYLRGNLGGHGLSFTGNLTVPAGATLTIAGGTLVTTGAMALDNSSLVMTNAADRVTVGGNFTARGPDSTGKLTNGRLYVKGNFTQSSTNSEKSFAASDSHATIFMGSSAQTVSFDKPDATTGSHFAKIYILNPATDFSSITNFTSIYSSYCQTSASLSGLTGTGGTMVPAFSASATHYIYVLPKGTTSTTLTASVAYQNMDINGNAHVTSLSIPVSGVPYDGSVTQTITVTAEDGIAETIYTVKVEQLNLDLSGIGLSAGAGALTPAFDAATLTYSVTLPASVDKVTLTPSLDHADSTCKIGDASVASREYTVNPGATVPVNIDVTGQNGTSTRRYTVNITRGAMLTGIDASTGTLVGVPSGNEGFDSPTAAYTLNIDADQSAALLTPHAASGCTFTIDGEAVASKNYDIALGGQTTATVVATAGSVQFTYTITIHRLPIISGFLQSTISGAVLSPSFSATSLTYTLTVPASVGTVNVSPVKTNCSALKIGSDVVDNKLVTLLPGESQTLNIVASKNAFSVTYSLTVVKDPIITDLDMSQGSLSFSPTTLAYTVDVPATSGPVYVTPTLASGSAAVAINGTAWNPGEPVTVDPAPGATDELKVKGTLGSGSVTFTITVRRQKPVSGITLSTGMLSPAFDTREADYIVNLPLATTAITVTPTVTAGCSSFTVNGTAAASVTLTPGIGCTENAVIAATGAGGAVTTYTVHVVRAALLSNISVSKGALSPTFSGGVLNYAVYLPSTTKSVRITPAKSGCCSYFTINGKKVKSITLSPVSGGAASATIVAVGSPSSLTQTFKVKVYRISPVTGIKLSTGKLSPKFSMGKANYTVSIPATKGSVTITPVRGASCANLTIDGAAVTSKTLSPQIGCSLKATIAATAVNGKVYTYTVTVSRAALLKGISLSSGTFSPAYNVTKFDYTVTVPATTSSVKVTPKKAATGVRSMTINGKKATSVTLKPVIGGSAKATIVLTAKDGKTKQTYTVTVNRQPLLTGLASSAGTLSPAFNPAVTSYTVLLPADTDATTLTVEKAATGVKSVTINTAAVMSQAISIPTVCGTSTVSIVATAANGTTKATYTVKVVRAPIISGITVTGGTLSPSFSPTTASYTVSAPATSGKVTLTPVKAAACATLTIDGAAVDSKEYALPVGGSVTATITCGTSGGHSRTYTVKITRAALVTNIKTGSSTCKLSPAFAATTLNYTVTMPASKSSVTIYATKAKKGVKSMTMNGRSVTELTVRRNATGVSTVKVAATASDGVTKVMYTVTVNWS